MRLRTKLALAFALLAGLPLLVLTLVARATLARASDEELDARLEGASHAAALSLAGEASEAERAASDLATSEPLQALAQSLADDSADLASTVHLAEPLMASRGVDVLEILDRSGRILSSGHVPARAGDADAEGLAFAQAGSPARLMSVEVRTDRGIQKTLAVVASHAVESGSTRLYVLAGRRLGEAFVKHLAELTGAEAHLRDAQHEIAASGSGSHEASRSREVPLALGGAPAAGAITLQISAVGLREAQASLFDTVALLALLALVLAAIGGAAIAVRITEPVDALAAGARQLARGELGRRVEVSASGEIGELVASFNAMSADLRAATERAALAERIAAWQEVARRLAHELKNPLTPIRMSVETLQQAYAKKRTDFDEIFRESATAIVESVDRLKRTIDEFSRFARLPAPQLAPLDLAELAGSVLAIYAGSQVELVRELAPVPSVRGDRDQLTQVLVNLLQNADQAMGGKGRCTVRTREREARVELEVEDTGPGVPESERQKIFEPYYTTKETGSGLGLAICQRIVAEHGGRLEVLAGASGGACFRLTLPRAG